MIGSGLLSEIRLVQAKIETLVEKPDFEPSAGLRNILAAIVVAEDRRFYSHPGFDLIGIVRAAYTWLWKGRRGGASTIEQQLVRTIRGRYEVTVERKLTEIVIASVVSHRFSKVNLVNAYATCAYFGWRGNGLRQFANRLGLVVEGADIRDAAMIAAALKVPLPQFPSQTLIDRWERRIEHIHGLLQRTKETDHGMGQFSTP